MPLTETREKRLRRLAREEGDKAKRRPGEARAEYLRRLAASEGEDGVRKNAPPRRFAPAPNSAPLPTTAHPSDPDGDLSGVAKALADPPVPREVTTIDETRAALHDLSDASQRHRTQRISTDPDGRSVTVSDRDEGGASTVVPAVSIDQLGEQVAKLIAAFREAEGRDPGADDAGFWTAYRDLITAFASAQRGSDARATEPLNTDAPTGATPPVQRPGDSTASHARTPVRKGRSR